MPTKRKRVTRNWQGEALSPGMYAYLLTGDIPDQAGMEVLLADRDELNAAWAKVRDQALHDWAQENPGTRPWHWWVTEAPEPVRRRLGGTGDDYAACGRNQSYHHCLPRHWISQWMVDYNNGRGKTIHGTPAQGTEKYHKGHWPYTGYDDDDPPRFESEPAYLQRHALLTAAERRRLTAKDFEPVVIGGDDEEPTR